MKTRAVSLLLLTALILAALASCGADTPESTPAPPSSTPAISPDAPTPEPTPTPDLDNSIQIFTVTRIVDGDTIEIDYNGTREIVRLIGVDTPESVHPNASVNSEFGEAASNFTESYLHNSEISLYRSARTREGSRGGPMGV